MSESVDANQPGRVSLEDFTLIKVIGKGTYGKVMLVRHKKVCTLIHHLFLMYVGWRSIRDEDVTEGTRCEEEPGGAHKN